MFPTLAPDHRINQFFRVTTNIGDKAILGLGLGIPLFFNCYDPAIFGKQRLSRLMVALLAWATIILVSRHVAEPSLTGQHISRHFISQYNANSFPNIFQVIALGANHYDGYAAHAITLYGVLIFRQVASCIPLLIMPSYRPAHPVLHMPPPQPLFCLRLLLGWYVLVKMTYDLMRLEDDDAGDRKTRDLPGGHGPAALHRRPLLDPEDPPAADPPPPVAAATLAQGTDAQGQPLLHPLHIDVAPARPPPHIGSASDGGNARPAGHSVGRVVPDARSSRQSDLGAPSRVAGAAWAAAGSRET